MTRRITGLLALSLILGLILFDLSTAQVNPYRAPPIIALGSGVASAGGFLRRTTGLTRVSGCEEGFIYDCWLRSSP